MPRHSTYALRCFLACLLLAASAAEAAAQSDRLRFRRYGTDDGLPTAGVRGAVQDRQGFLWLTSAAGLIRFDGRHFLTFDSIPDADGRAAPLSARAVLEDAGSRFWVGTDLGLYLLDRRTRVFARVPAPEAEQGDSTTLSVTSLLEGAGGEIRVGTYAHGVCVVDEEAFDLDCRRHAPDDPGSLPSDHVVGIAEGADGALWVATGDAGIARHDPATDAFETFRHDPADPTSLPGDEVNTVHVDRSGDVWVGFYSMGLARLDRRGRLLSHFMPDTADAGSLPARAVRAVLEDDAGRLWIATWAGGVAVLDRDTGRFTVARRDPDDASSLSDDRALGLAEDDLGQIWVASYDGLNVHDPRAQAFGLLRRRPGDPSSLADDKVRAILEAADGHVWIGTYGEGLSRWDPETGRVESFGHRPDDPTSLANEGIWALHEDARGRVWVATSRGLHRWDPGIHGFVRYQKRQDTPEPFSDNNILSVTSDRDGAVWMGTWGRGLNRLDPETGAVEQVLPEPGGVPEAGVHALLVDDRNRLWIATGEGLARMDLGTRAIDFIGGEEEGSAGAPAGFPESLYLDADGRIWVGTSTGLERWDEATGRLVALPADVGPFAVHGIARGAGGELWLGTTRGLARFDEASGLFTWFDEADGLQGDVFASGAAHAGRSGRLYFGGSQGLTWFRPGDVTENRSVPEVVITDFLLLNRPVPVGGDSPLSTDVAYADRIVLDHTDYSFSFEVAALNLRQPEKNAYRYMLEGIDPDWVDLDPRFPRITYTGVRPGTYVFRVQGSNDDGLWNEGGASVAVRVLPPWWQTTWFRGASAGMLLLFTVGTFRWRTAALERRNALLEEQVTERTAELRQSNLQLAEASRTDPLTGLRNRRFLAEHLEGDLVKALRDARTDAPGDTDVVFALLDVDHFKAINDAHGHDAGDLVLRGVADTLREASRGSDFVVRWGGEEFLVVGRFTDRAQAFDTAERLRAAVAAEEYDIGGGRTLRATISSGVACFPFHPAFPEALTWEQVVGLADRALYVAKRGGRNATVVVRAADAADPEDLARAAASDFDVAASPDGPVVLETSFQEA